MHGRVRRGHTDTRVTECLLHFKVCLDEGVPYGRTDICVTKCLLHFAEIADGGILHAVCQPAVQTCMESNFLSVALIRTLVLHCIVLD